MKFLSQQYYEIVTDYALTTATKYNKNLSAPLSIKV